MKITTQTEIFYSVEMTSDQADSLREFLVYLEPQKLESIDKIFKANDTQKIELSETLTALLDVLKSNLND